MILVRCDMCKSEISPYESRRLKVLDTTGGKSYPDIDLCAPCLLKLMNELGSISGSAGGK